MSRAVADTCHDGETITVHYIAIEQWLFNHRGAVACHDVSKLWTILGNLFKVTLFVGKGILLEEPAANVVSVGQLVVRTNHLCSLNNFFEPGCAYQTIG